LTRNDFYPVLNVATSGRTSPQAMALGQPSPKLSIVVCSYNQAAFVRDALESLVNQEGLRPGELEIIVIDGGSTDGSTEIINKYVQVDDEKALVVGVVKDFNNKSFRAEISPIAIFSSYKRYYNCAVSISMAKVKPVMTAIEKTWNGIYPDYIFKGEFLDERIARFYQLDDTMLKLIEAFAGIAIFIGCLGLYGLVSFMAVRKPRKLA